MVVRHRFRTVHSLLRFICRSLTQPESRNLKMMVLGLLICGSGKLRTLARTTSDPERHRTSLSRFLRSSGWPEADTVPRAARRVLQSMKPRRGETVSLLIDDTTIEKRGQKIDAVKKSYDHSIGKFCDGHTVLLLALRFRGVVIPWSVRLWLPRSFCRDNTLEFRKLTQLAADRAQRRTHARRRLEEDFARFSGSRETAIEAISHGIRTVTAIPAQSSALRTRRECFTRFFCTSLTRALLVFFANEYRAIRRFEADAR